jgi:predicted transposase YbfD/YdcC
MKIESRFSDIFSELKDHRMNRTKLHSLENIMFISLAAVISGAETWNEIEEFGNEKLDWLTKYLDMPNGIPSHDTFNRFFSTMDPGNFEEVFRKWVSTLQRETHGDIVSIDGKSIRGSKGNNLHAVHIVSAWSKNSGITLGQIPTSQKTGELTVIPQLLDALFLDGSIVTLDALGAQVNIASKIVEKNADYILQIKNNRKQMVRDIEFSFKVLPVQSTYEFIDRDHGREEKRLISVLYEIDILRKYEQWVNLKSIIRIESQSKNIITSKVESHTAYYISSLGTDAKHIGSAIRSHWGIENSLHWMLDVAFSEDRGRKRNENAVVNFSLVNKIALEMLRKEDSKKIGVKSRRLKSAWSTSYLEKVLGLL